MKEQIAIHIDDLGASEGGDSCLNENLLQYPNLTCSVIAKLENIDYLQNVLFPKLSAWGGKLFVHLNLLEGSPLIVAKKAVPRTPWLYLLYSFFPIRFRNRLFDYKKAHSELSTQIRFFQNSVIGNQIVGIDGHMHLHLFPSLRPVTEKLLVEFPFLKIRIIDEKFSLPLLKKFKFRYLKGIPKLILLRSWSSNLAEKYPNRVVIFTGVNQIGLAGLDNATISTVGKENTPLILHPNYDAQFPASHGPRLAKFYASVEREKEKAALNQYLERVGI